MKTRWLNLFLLIVLAVPVLAQPPVHSGLLMDDEAYERVPYEEILTKEPLPDRFSFEPFCPPVQAQGAYGTCVGFACAYYLCTIMEAKDRPKTRRDAIQQIAFSPSYLYEKAKSNRDYACTEGVYLTRAFTVLKEIGVVPFRAFPYPACGQVTKRADALASRYRIPDYERLFAIRDSELQKIQNLKRALAQGSPVVVGLVVPASFYSAGKRWKPAPGDHPQDPRLRGHALCVIGYDDRRYGGAFRVVNSFGKAWGEGGFCWIAYRDMALYTRYGYKISGKENE